MTAAMERTPWRILSTLLLVFAAGATTGGLVMQLGLHDKLHRTTSAASHEPNREVVLQKLRTELNLSGEQVQGIALVLEDYRQYYQSLQEQLDDLRATGKTRIVQILNPDQRVKFEKMMTDLAPQLAGGGK